MAQLTQSDTPCRNTRSRAWCFTWNNFNQTNINYLVEILADHEYIFGEEIGEHTNTPHLQGVVRFKNARTFNSVRKLFENNHIEPCKNWAASKNYCSKDNKIHTNIIKNKTADEQYEEYMHQLYDDIKWYDWQKNIINLLDTKPDERKVYWFYEENGNHGKSFLAKYLDWKHNAIIANGKQSDVFNQYSSFLEEFKTQPSLAIIDIPRSHKEYVCYSTLEKIKDGLVYSGKYEGAKLRLIPHHLIVFANFRPNENKLSEDRWVITEL